MTEIISYLMLGFILGCITGIGIGLTYYKKIIEWLKK